MATIHETAYPRFKPVFTWGDEKFIDFAKN